VNRVDSGSGSQAGGGLPWQAQYARVPGGAIHRRRLELEPRGHDQHGQLEISRYPLAKGLISHMYAEKYSWYTRQLVGRRLGWGYPEQLRDNGSYHDHDIRMGLENPVQCRCQGQMWMRQG